MITLKGTKEIIFDSAVRLIAEKGFPSVNMREIAAACKIKAASIYNHFEGKQEILDTIYDYYESHFWDSKRPDDEVMSLINTGTKEQIVQAITISFIDGDEKKYVRMVLITKIVYMRLFEDSRARKIFSVTMTRETEAYLVRLLEYGIAEGRLKPFDYVTYAQLFVECRHSMAIKAFSTDDYTIGQLEEESRLDKLLLELLPLAETV